MLALHVLGSGSKGNASVVEDVDSRRGVLVDCGLCKRDVLTRSEECGFDVRGLAAVLATHDHADHTKGLGVVMRGLARLDVRPPIYVLPGTAAASAHVRDLAEEWDVRTFSTSDVLGLGFMTVRPFATSHDAADSCGFRFESADGDVLGYVTDTGVLTEPARAGSVGARILALEANHDPATLRKGTYPPHVKARIASDVGHLSNEQAARALAELLHEGLEHVVALHVSENNNMPMHVRAALQPVLDACGHGAKLHVAAQRLSLSVR